MFAGKQVNFTDIAETVNFSILQVLEVAPWFKHGVASYLNIQNVKVNGSVFTL